MKLFRPRPFALIPLAAALAGCNPMPPGPVALVTPARDPLYAPTQVTPGRLEYAAQPDTFAPVLTHRVTYPTQQQANDALLRDMAAIYPPTSESLSQPDRRAVRVHLFACRPGTLNDVTGRVERSAPSETAVHCATDFFNARGERLSRETVNYDYYADAWHMRSTNPPQAAAPWINPERSPTDYFAWLPFSRRSTPYRN